MCEVGNRIRRLPGLADAAAVSAAVLRYPSVPQKHIQLLLLLQLRGANQQSPLHIGWRQRCGAAW